MRKFGIQYCGGGGAKTFKKKPGNVSTTGPTGRRGAVEAAASATRQYATRVGGPVQRRGGPQGRAIGAIARGA